MKLGVLRNGKRTLRAADLFCGAGGTSTALIRAARKKGYLIELRGFNHWDIAIDTHHANHPDQPPAHLADIDSVNPRDHYKPGELDILWASPECIYHSNARGGKPINDQRRATAFCICRWAEALLPPLIEVENVKEFLKWGPLDSRHRPIKKRAGETFMAWVRMLESLGYRVDWRVICCADHGDATTRERLFIKARRGRWPIIWPEPTHARITDVADLFNITRKPWRAAREIIDWTIKGQLLSERKRPLKPKTMRRIILGFYRFGLKPYIIPQQSGGRPRSISEPLPAITTTARGVALAEPFLAHLRGQSGSRSVDEPVPAITAGGGHLALIEPYLIQVAHGNGTADNADARRTRSVEEPLPTVCGERGEWSLIEPYITTIDHQSNMKGGNHSLDEPLTTITTEARHGLVEPFLIPFFGERDGQEPRAHSINDPLPAVTSHGAGALIEPYLIKFYGSNIGQSVDAPLDTVTTKDRFGLTWPIIVEIQGQAYVVDFRFRMLQPHELAGAQGFPKGYKFCGNKTEVVCQIGNAVPGETSEALVDVALPPAA